jgi:hypothetical protein
VSEGAGAKRICADQKKPVGAGGRARGEGQSVPWLQSLVQTREASALHKHLGKDAQGKLSNLHAVPTHIAWRFRSANVLQRPSRAESFQERAPGCLACPGPPLGIIFLHSVSKALHGYCGDSSGPRNSPCWWHFHRIGVLQAHRLQDVRGYGGLHSD